ncbi:hypothetical protein FRB90_003289 [Tulasnella sp. 427]|nr:hypothetical protein FRB90_003289 [Tulasnella sp. 427]
MEYGKEGWDYVTDISRAHLTRFHRLRNLVRSLTHANTSLWRDKRSKISTRALESAVSQLLPDSTSKSLLPAVRTVAWYAGASYKDPQLLFFVSPSLETLIFNCFGPSTPAGIHGMDSGTGMLSRLAQVSCRLRRIQFTWGWGESAEPLEQALAALIRQQNGLRSFSSLMDLSEETFRALTSSNTTLQSLDCRLSSTHALAFRSFAEIMSTGFNRLEKLAVQSNASIDFTSINPLLACPSLRELSVRAATVAALQPSGVKAMAEAWPQIEDLRLRSQVPERPHVHQLSILSSLAKDMGSTLQTIELDFRVDVSTQLPSVKEPNTFKVLRQIRVGEVDRIAGGREDDVARYLLSLCLLGISIAVGVSDLFGESPNDITLTRGWRKVQLLLQNPQQIKPIDQQTILA